MEDGALHAPQDGSWPPARRALRLGEDREDGARSTIFNLLSSIFRGFRCTPPRAGDKAADQASDRLGALSKCRHFG